MSNKTLCEERAAPAGPRDGLRSQSNAEASPARSETVRGFAESARDYIASAIEDIEKALNVATYMGRNGELLRQLNITRTQLQTAQLWASSAQEQVARATEEHGS